MRTEPNHGCRVWATRKPVDLSLLYPRPTPESSSPHRSPMAAARSPSVTGGASVAAASEPHRCPWWFAFRSAVLPTYAVAPTRGYDSSGTAYSRTRAPDRPRRLLTRCVAPMLFQQIRRG